MRPNRKSQRTVYLELASEVGFTMCAFCKFSKCESGYSPCDIGEPYCIHPLADRFSHSYSSFGIEPGCDCWGFRPEYDISFCADIIGILLVKGWDDAVWWRNKKGIWKVAEVN